MEPLHFLQFQNPIKSFDCSISEPNPVYHLLDCLLHRYHCLGQKVKIPPAILASVFSFSAKVSISLSNALNPPLEV